MLEALRFKDVGPAPEMSIEFKPRMNFLVGDNGLGKTFLLDVAWWVLTRSWAGHPVLPHPTSTNPTIFYRYTQANQQKKDRAAIFHRDTEQWSVDPGRPAIPGLVLYAQVDGGFSVWDPARNYWKKESPQRPISYLFTADEIWGGHEFCEGLIRDWASWQREDGTAFQELKRVLRTLSPSPEEPLELGELRKISLDDPKRYPTLKMPYQQEVAVVHASAGIKRIIAIAYLLVWTWQEHLAACELRKSTPTKQIIFLIDEIEAHLHPQWQRRIVPALLDVMEVLTGEHDVQIQLIAATHAPLILASTETLFDDEKDAIWELDLCDNVVSLTHSSYRKRDANAWLTSSAFDLKEPRSLQAEQAITRALELLKQPEPTVEDIRNIDSDLRKSLGDVDKFWIRWSSFVENIGKFS